MANIRVRDADGLTYAYLWAEGEGKEENPYKSKYLVAQEGDWSVAINNLPSVYAVEGTVDIGNYDILVTALTNSTLQVDTGIVLPSSFASVQEGDWSVSVSNLSELATVEKQNELIAKLPEGLAVVDGKLKVDANVTLPNSIEVTGTISVDNFPDNQPVSIVALPALAAGNNEIGSISNTTFAASQSGTWVVDTELDQPLTLTELEGITVNVSEQNPLSLAGIEAILTELTFLADRLKVDANVTLPSSYPITGAVSVDNFPATQPVSFSSLPTGTNIIGGISNTSFGASQSGDWTVAISNLGDVSINTAGLATDTTLTSIQNKIPANLTVTGDRLKVNADVSLPSTYTVNGTVGINNYSDLATLLANTTLQADVSGSFALDKTGLATDTNQVTINTTLSSINNNIPTLESGRTPVVLSAAQITALTPPTTVTANLGTIAGVATAANQSTIIGHIDGIESALAGTIRNNPINAGTPTLTNVASSATSVTLIAANANRKTLIIVNDSTATIYLKFDASTASTTSYSHVLPPITNGIPYVLSLNGSDYSGEIRGIWSSANGFARITEIV
jgi:hypothetical protein